MSYTGWLIPEPERERLLTLFAPRYPDTIAHHITLRMGKANPPQATHGIVIGVADDGVGCQALVVSIDGTTRRPDGRTYHITWSIDRQAGYKPVHSNDVISIHGWTPVDPIEINLIPQIFD